VDIISERIGLSPRVFCTQQSPHGLGGVIASLDTNETRISTKALSICIVTLQARDYLRKCLESIYANPYSGPIEIIVIDNHSQDGTLEFLRQEYPNISVIKNDHNAGYTLPNNQGLRLAQGDYLMLLNPDTLVLPGGLDGLVNFMEKHPEAGICGPKVLNRDGSLQQPCRRGEPRPLAVISYFLGLSRLFPKSKVLGGYLLNYLPEDETHLVAGVSGSCMLIRREVINQIGYLDERFFAYQEDTDFCLRARQAGWQIVYYPRVSIIHYGGKGGTRVEPYHSILAWHKSYFLYYRKNLARDYFFLFNWLYYGAMLLKFLSSLFINLFRREKFAGPQRNIKDSR